MTSAKRILFAVGCDAYDFMRPLQGAEQDASNIFNTLTSPDYGDYPATDAIFLASPTYSELLTALRSVFISRQPLDTVTFFFAGHGGVVRGSYYLCIKDSTPSMLSTTALPLNQLFTIINEVQPSQCNIIIDACQGGGLVTDVGALLKPELLGGANTLGVSIFASSAANEYSADTPQGGIGTIALLTCIKGEEVVQTHRPYIDLIELGRVAADKLTQAGATQTPVVWGLNLFGQSRFTKNPHFAGTSTSSLYQLTNVPPTSPSGKKIIAHADRLWRIYYALPDAYDSRTIWTALSDVTNAFGADKEGAASFILGITRALTERCAGSNDLFREIEMLALGTAVLLPLTDSDTSVNQAVELLAGELLAQLNSALTRLDADLSLNPYGLLNGGLADLYYLPLRVTRILGWLGTGLILSSLIKLPAALDREAHRTFVGRLLETYAPSLVAMTDSQTPFAMTFLAAASVNGWQQECETAFGCILSSFIDVKGKLSIEDLAPDKVLEYLLRRRFGDFDNHDLIAQPVELLSLLLLAAPSLGLVDAVDPYLEAIDHLHFKVFIPNSHRDFANHTIKEGRNHVFQIGHGVWSVSDFLARWHAACLPQMATDTSLQCSATQIGALLAAMLFPNRTPWFAARTLAPNGASGPSQP